MHTRARCLVIDPNSDFRRFHRSEEASLWNDANYDLKSGRGKLPHESTQGEFRNAWRSRLSFAVTVGEPVSRRPYSRLSLWWPALGMDFVAAELDSLDRAELYHCHSYVQALAELTRLRHLAGMQDVKVLPLAERIYRSVKDIVGNDNWKAAVLSEVQDAFPPKEIVSRIEDAGNLVAAVSAAFGPAAVLRGLLKMRLEELYDRAVASLDYFADHVARFYFGRVAELRAARILADFPPEAGGERPRVRVLDLPSLPNRRVRLLAINSILTLEWERARAEWRRAVARPQEEDTRVPTFVVVDEAHFAIPAQPTDDLQRSIREQFRELVAEGRKYGLFLIVASQRPDRLDELIVGECENRVVMRLNSVRTLERTRAILGLEDVPNHLLDETLSFGIGRALIAGHWTPDGPQRLYTAARRTIEGGRDLRSDFWATSSDAP